MRFAWVNMTPLEKPVVPLEYGRATRSRSGLIDTAGASPALASKVPNDVAPFDSSPKTKTSSMPDFFAAGNARSKNSGTVNKNLEPLSFNWCKRSCSE